MTAMSRSRISRWALVPLLAVVAACVHDVTATPDERRPSPPPPPPPPSAPSADLWTASALEPAILRLSARQLEQGGSLVAATRLTTPSADLFRANSVAFDADGTLWVASPDDSLLVAFPPVTLGASGSRDAAVVITSRRGSLSTPTALAFDGERRLWVANFTNGTLVRFDRAQLASGGAAEPAVVISGSGGPRGLAFDAAGSLWVSDGQSNRLLKYTATQLASSGAPEPDVVLGAIGESLATPSGLAFDASGNLWVANLDGQSVVGFSPGQLAASGSPAPHVTLSPTSSGRPVLPVGLAFDGEGSLWVVSGDGVIYEYDRSVLGATGAPRPRVELTIEGHSLLWSAAFWPRPAGLPLR
jgi:sugar lactone lactonase YvrE